MAVTVIQRGIRGFFSQIVGFVVRFVLSERIARWIADQGGWVSIECVSYELRLYLDVFVAAAVHTVWHIYFRLPYNSIISRVGKP